MVPLQSVEPTDPEYISEIEKLNELVRLSDPGRCVPGRWLVWAGLVTVKVRIGILLLVSQPTVSGSKEQGGC